MQNDWLGILCPTGNIVSKMNSVYMLSGIAKLKSNNSVDSALAVLPVIVLFKSKFTNLCLLLSN